MGVYILAKKTRGVKYLYAIETQYTDLPNGKRHRTQRVLKSFGRLDRLLKQDPNIIDHLKTLYCHPNSNYDAYDPDNPTLPGPTMSANSLGRATEDTTTTFNISSQHLNAPPLTTAEKSANIPAQAGTTYNVATPSSSPVATNATSNVATDIPPSTTDGHNPTANALTQNAPQSSLQATASSDSTASHADHAEPSSKVKKKDASTASQD